MAEGIGRGGRGALLLEALRNQQRRPGGTDEPPPSQNVSTPAVGRASGRGSLLSNLVAQRSANAATSGSGGESLAPISSFGSIPASVPAVGRGRAGLLQALTKTIDHQPVKTTVQLPKESKGDVTRKLQELSLESNPPITRKGEAGKVISATANYIRLALNPGRGVYMYEVRFDPDVDSKGMRMKIVGQLVDVIGKVKIFDGVILFLPIKLPQETTLANAKHPQDSSPITVSIIFRREQRLGQSLQLCNLLIRRIMHTLDLVRVGRHNFNPRAAHRIPQHKLEVWPGYVTAIDEYEGGVQLCCDASHKVLRNETVSDVISGIVRRNLSNYRDEVIKQVLGMCVLTRYNNNTYRVDDILWDMNPKSTFDYRGQEISYMEYYKKNYDLTISDPEQPLLLHRKKVRVSNQKEPVVQMICLIPELCSVTGLSDAMRSDFKVMKDIAMYTRITPNQRQAALMKYIDNINQNPEAKQILADWGLSLDENTVSLEARVVPVETIYFGKGVSVPGTPQADWSRAATSNEVLSAIDLVNWLVIHVSKDRRVAMDFSSMMCKVGSQMGIHVREPQFFNLKDDRTDSFLTAIRENVNREMQIVVIICPTARDDRYAAVKKLCCAELPVASQVINSRTLLKQDKLRSVTQKIALQMNCKLGGTLWAVKIPLSNCMVCGIDTYHDASRRNNSVSAFVASLNNTLTRWYSKVSFQGKSIELMDGLRACFTGALQKYYEVNHKFPDRIVIYRDGVGDGQLTISRDYELPQFQSVFSQIKQDYSPKLTMVICQKRINTRIFARTNAGLENPPPGTVMDHTVTRRNWYDFFLVSQNVRQGTVSPTHYVVVYDDSEMKPDHVQRLTYKMCHLYYNWPGTVRVPAPCQYAHKLAQLVGQNIRKEPSEKLSDRLYFL